MQLILDESTEVLRAERGVLITRTRHGFVCANAGIDSSNVPGDAVALLPEDPDASARALRAGLGPRLGDAPAVVVSDSFGRAWRLGQVEVAIGCAGLAAAATTGAASATRSARELTATVDRGRGRGRGGRRASCATRRAARRSSSCAAWSAT